MVTDWSAERPQWQVRIRRKPDEPPVGAGMLCNNSYVVTCAHVIGPGGSRPTEPVFVEFQFANRHDPIPAMVIDDGWHPERQDRSGDIAVLKLQGPLPFGARSAPISDTKGIKGHPFSAYGYPRGHELDGIWSEGSIGGRVKAEWFQLKVQSNPGYLLQSGFSGAPIFDDQLSRVVGIVVAYDKDKNTWTGFGIPTEVIRWYWPELGPSVPIELPQPRWEDKWAGLPPRWLRITARLIDLFIVVTLAITTWMLAGRSEMTQESSITLGIAVGLGYEPLAMFLFRTTLGKLTCNIEPVAVPTDEPLGRVLAIGRVRAMGRGLMVNLFLFLLTPLLLVSLCRLWRDPAQQCLHDTVVKTLVLRRSNYKSIV